MPVSWTTVFRVIVLLLMAAHVFYQYSLAGQEGWLDGAGAAGVLGRSFFALVMLLPLSWAVLLPDLPEIYRRHQRLRRYMKGRCPQCNYPVRVTEQVRCPECGRGLEVPADYRLGWAVVRHFAALALLAWLIGCAAAQTWIVVG